MFEIVIQIDDSGFKKCGVLNIKLKFLKDYVVVVKYMNWRKIKKGLEKECMRDYLGFFIKLDMKYSFLLDFGVSVISGYKMFDLVSRGVSMFEMSFRSRNVCVLFMLDKYFVYNLCVINRYVN